MNDLQDVTDLFLIAAIPPLGDLFTGISQMSASLRSFDNYSIRCAVMVSEAEPMPP